jgi:hypothetical protein
VPRIRNRESRAALAKRYAGLGARSQDRASEMPRRGPISASSERMPPDRRQSRALLCGRTRPKPASPRIATHVCCYPIAVTPAGPAGTIERQVLQVPRVSRQTAVVSHWSCRKGYFDVRALTAGNQSEVRLQPNTFALGRDGDILIDTPRQIGSSSQRSSAPDMAQIG